MRYFFVAFALFTVLVIGLAGFRGKMSRKPPIEVFPDMDRHLKLRPQDEASFFSDGRSSRLPVAGTVPRSAPYLVAGAGGMQQVFGYEDSPVNTGRITGTTNF